MRPARRSSTMFETPRRLSRADRTRPDGPPPTIKTSVVWCGADASKRALPGGSAPAGDVCERAQLAKLAKLALALAQGQGQGQDGEPPTVACMDKRRV